MGSKGPLPLGGSRAEPWPFFRPGYFDVVVVFGGNGRSGRSAPKPGAAAEAAVFEAFGFFTSRPLRF